MKKPERTSFQKRNGNRATAGIRWLSEINQSDRDRVGTKATRLGELLAAGVSVPAGFCIPLAAYTANIAASDQFNLQRCLKQRQFADIRRGVQQMRLNPVLADDLRRNYQALMALSPGLVAVRSSSTAEDLGHASFAGLYDTVLNVADESALVEATLQCWASYWSEAAVCYREQMGLPHTAHGMAVIVQAMLQPTCGGVLFTRDVLAGATPTSVIEMVPGTAETLVEGKVRGSRMRISRATGELLEMSHAESPLGQTVLTRLLALGLELEHLQGGPQDIEWCVDTDAHIWILQTRPITGGPETPVGPRTPVPAGWLRAYDEPFSPLGCDLAIRRHHYWVRAVNAYYKTTFSSETRTLNGLFYYKLPLRSSGGLTRLWTRLWQCLNWLRADSIEKHYQHRVLPAYAQQITALESCNISRLIPEELVQALHASIAMYLDLQHTSYPIVELAKTSVSLLECLCHLWLDRSHNLRVSDLLMGLDNRTVSRDLALDQLGKALGRILPPDELADLHYQDLTALEQAPDAARDVWLTFQAFLDDYGYVWADRYPRDPAWEVNQEACVAALTHIAQSPHGAGLAQGHLKKKALRAQAIESVQQQLASGPWFPWRWSIFSFVLTRAERLFPHKEDRNHDVYRAVMVIRKYARELGRRWREQKLLRAENDIFSLTWEEIQSVAVKKAAITELRQIIQSRQRQDDHNRRLTIDSAQPLPPDKSSVALNENPSEFVGEPCSAGIAIGPARLLSGLSELQCVQPGDIVVCRDMRPAWSTVFSRAGGVVFETGSLLSHGATLAREYGVPAVMNVSGVTQLIHEGDQLLIDGKLGIIRIEAS